MDGMKLTECSPTFVAARNGILAADVADFGGANRCLIWKAFAKRGLGFSAVGGGSGVGDEVPAFDLPGDCPPKKIFVAPGTGGASNVREATGN
jgi:hypothetical protein